MATSVPSPTSLTDLTVEGLVHLLNAGFWREQPWYADNRAEGNPFCELSPFVLEQVVAAVFTTVRINESVLSSLRPVLCCGRLQNFTMYLTSNVVHEAGAILYILSWNAQNLKTFSLYLATTLMEDDGELTESIGTNLDAVLRRATNLESLSTDLYFNFRLVQNMTNLQTLKLHTVPIGIRDIVPHTGATPLTDASPIRCLFIDSAVPPARCVTLDIVFLLAHLPNLQFIQWDIAEALDFMHGEQVDKGQVGLSIRKYKLTKAYLFPKNIRHLKVFTVTCPNVQNLHLFLENLDLLDSMTSLCKLIGLTKLVLEAPEESYIYQHCNFASHCLPILIQARGFYLYEVKIQFKVGAVDYKLLHATCPRLKKLKISIRSELPYTEPFVEHFELLEELELTYCKLNENYFAYGESLMMLLTSVKLRSLALINAHHLTDTLMESIICVSRFHQLQELFLYNSRLTLAGLGRLISRAVNLKCVGFSSAVIAVTQETLTGYVQHINPNIEVR